MRAIRRNLKAIVAATLLAAAAPLPGPGHAQELSEATLLAELAESDSAAAAAIDRELQALWSRSGSPAMDLLLRRGRDAFERGSLDEAVEHLTALTDHAPDFARGWHARARAYHAQGLYGPAVADLERALALNPQDYDAIFALGALLEQFGTPARAYEAYLRAKAIHPHHKEVTTALNRLRPLIEGREL